MIFGSVVHTKDVKIKLES